jgi:pimeloyl-ACP methyl ester carboxylesterase
MGAVRPGAIGAVVLNDIGPRVEAPGWMRLMGRVGRVPVPKNWSEAARFVKELEKRDYPKLTDGNWAKLARQRYFDRNGVPAPGYDAAISRAFSLTSISTGVPSMWPQFRALCRVPLLLMRGENSDVLSSATANEMQSLHPRMRTVTVPHQGHAPLLNDDSSAGAILSFLTEADGRVEQDRDILSSIHQPSQMPAPARLGLAGRLRAHG